MIYSEHINNELLEGLHVNVIRSVDFIVMAALNSPKNAYQFHWNFFRFHSYYISIFMENYYSWRLIPMVDEVNITYLLVRYELIQ